MKKRRDMTFEERRAYYNESAERFFASMGKPVPYAKVGPDGLVL